MQRLVQLAQRALFGSVLLAAGIAHADPLVGDSLPASTRWVMHVDVDAARLATPLWDFARLKIVEPRRDDIMPKLAIFERLTGMKLPTELHDVTLYGSSFDEAAVCVRVRGVMDKLGITNFLHSDPEFQQTDHAGHDILRWRDHGKDRLMYAGFEARESKLPINTWVILSADPKTLEVALDAMDRKVTVKVDSPLFPQNSADPKAVNPILWLAAQGLSDLPRVQKVESPVLSQVDAASLSLRWANDRVTAGMRVQAKTEKTAQELQAVAEGVKAFVALSAADEHALPRLRILSNALQQMNVQAEGKTVKGEWSVELEKIELLMNLIMQEQAAGAMTLPRPPLLDRQP